MNTHEEQLLNAIVKQALEIVQLKDHVHNLIKDLAEKDEIVRSKDWVINDQEQEIRGLKKHEEAKKEVV